MATRHLISSGDRIWAARATWSLTKDGVAIGDDTWPGAGVGDTALLDGTGAGVGILTVSTLLPNALADLRMEETGGSAFSYSGLMDIANTLVVVLANLAGAITGSGNLNITGDIESTIIAADWSGYTGSVQAINSAAKTISVSGSGTIANFVVDNSDTLAALGPMTFVGSFTMSSGGALDMQNNALDVAGDIIASVGSIFNRPAVTMTADGAVENSLANRFMGFSVDIGVTATIANGKTLWVNGILSGDGDITGTGTGVINIREGPAGFWAITGDITSDVSFSDTLNAPGADIILLGDRTLTISGDSLTITMDADINIGAGVFHVLAFGVGQKMTVNMATFNLTCGQVIEGRDSAQTGSADIDLGSGTHNVASWDVGNDANTGNVLNFNTCNLTLTGIFDGNADGTNPIVATNTSAVVHGGEIQQLVITDNELNATDGVIDGGGNVLVNFGSAGPPAGSLTTMGVGI